MSKSTTIQELLGSDLTQGKALMGRYHSSSSLSIRERQRNQPKVCSFRRDRVLRKILKIQQERLVKMFTAQPSENATDANRPG
jgi:hypothetical protein